MQRFDSIQHKLDYKGAIQIGTDQNFNDLNVGSHKGTCEVLSTFIYVQIITKLTRINKYYTTNRQHLYTI